MVRSAGAEDLSQTAEPGPELDAGAKAILRPQEQAYVR